MQVLTLGDTYADSEFGHHRAAGSSAFLEFVLIVLICHNRLQSHSQKSKSKSIDSNRSFIVISFFFIWLFNFDIINTLVS